MIVATIQVIHLARKNAHDSESSHIERDTSAGLEFSAVDTSTTAHNISRTARGFHDKLFLRELPQDFSDNLEDNDLATNVNIFRWWGKDMQKKDDEEKKKRRKKRKYET